MFLGAGTEQRGHLFQPGGMVAVERTRAGRCFLSTRSDGVRAPKLERSRAARLITPDKLLRTAPVRDLERELTDRIRAHFQLPQIVLTEPIELHDVKFKAALDFLEIL